LRRRFEKRGRFRRRELQEAKSGKVASVRLNYEVKDVRKQEGSPVLFWITWK
jgi:hypothetical protein